MSAIAEFGQRKLLPVDYLAKRRVADEAGGGVRFNYGDEARARIHKSAATAHPTYWARGDNRPMRAFGHHLADRFAKRTDTTLFIVEGESDALTLWLHRRPALGVPGATMAHVVAAQDVGWAQCAVIVREPGEAGTQFVTLVARRLREVGFTGEITEITLAPHKDVSDLHVAVQGEDERFAAALGGAVARATPVDVAPAKAASEAGGVLTFDDLARKCTEQVDWFIEGLVRGSGILLIASQPKVGKSDTARNLAKAVATGTEFLGRRCRRGKVLWIGLEEPTSHLHERLEIMEMQALDIVYVVERQSRDEAAWLRALIERHLPAVVVIDTIGRFSNVEDINSYSDVKRATQPILDLRTQYGTTFALLHHNNRGNGVLGSVMWEGFVDTIMSITRNEDGARFAQTKQRSGIDMEATALTMNHDTGEITCAESKFAADRRAAENKILAILGETESASRHELAQHCGRPASVGRAAVDSLVTAGLLKPSGDGTKTSPRRYSLCTPFQNPISTKRESKDYITRESRESEESAPTYLPSTPEDSHDSRESEESLAGYAERVLGVDEP
jgi:hypothetical protein